MISSLRSPSKKASRELARRTAVINEGFQYRYTFYLVSAVLSAAVLAGGVSAYFLNQNYGIFKNLAYQHAPELLIQLQREQYLINIFLVLTVIALAALSIFYGLKQTQRMIGPLMILKHHITLASKGYLNQKDIKVREKDEFKDIVETYNYFYSTFQSQTLKDVYVLENLASNIKNAKDKKELNELLKDKRLQLNLNAERHVGAVDSRHVS